MTDDLINSGYFRRAGDIEGFIDEATGEHGFRSVSLGIEVRGTDYKDAEGKLHAALRAHAAEHGHDPSEHFRHVGQPHVGEGHQH